MLVKYRNDLPDKVNKIRSLWVHAIIDETIAYDLTDQEDYNKKRDREMVLFTHLSCFSFFKGIDVFSDLSFFIHFEPTEDKIKHLNRLIIKSKQTDLFDNPNLNC